MRRGDVVRVDLPAPAGAPGREQVGSRPAIVVQIDQGSARLGTVIVVPLTSNQQALRFLGSVSIAATPGNGLHVDSVALAAQVRAVDKRRIVRVLGKLAQADLAQLEAKLKFILGL
ncbi:MAG: type II toxin-antitoxin system PemK/MazF family toxin [Pirellulales bacterium]